MIVTVTPNPSVDRTVSLPTALTRGAVHRITTVSSEPGGKGVNVARALTQAGLDALAVLPAPPSDPFVTALAAAGVPFATVPVAAPVRTNLAITETDGTTTKLNEPGATLDAAALTALTDTVVHRAAGADWVVLSGSLPPGAPDDWYADVVSALRSVGCRVAVDTSDAPLLALAGRFGDAAPDLVKPNSDELASLAGRSAAELEDDPDAVVEAARSLVNRGVGAVLATLGSAGAVLVNAQGAWLATPPPITVRSTVGAGDSALAGYVRADVAGAEAPRRLQMAVAYGSAAAALPGSALPSPADLDLSGVHVVSVIPTTPNLI
ncbi:1-phosphofructokinase [Mycolicibacterium tokaiense]|uniref:1-phosphofructokinase n=1 Tax=Mycolicibacterium tokaiense TaxID=39695 RepID=A0A378TH91_9MYCO|nr:1-phosphofructokinase [Mycolicibacterium tokaiense]BBY85373.1 1-phosphofructokinase [Mycolicibacterium tokaiense]STZ60119.1 1-phosphofructokinase [Mycolicibacterium tokaiense]